LLGPYADNGIKYIVVDDATGIVGGVDEITARRGQRVSLRHALGLLSPSQ
jgi:hypothetical protein